MLEFLDTVRNTCVKNKIKLCLTPTNQLYADAADECLGYFDQESRVLAVAVTHPDWLTTLAHEYAHLQQYLENSKLTGLNCEADAERRALTYITTYNLESAQTYIPKANGYLFSLLLKTPTIPLPLHLMPTIASNPAKQITEEIKVFMHKGDVLNE